MITRSPFFQKLLLLVLLFSFLQCSKDSNDNTSSKRLTIQLYDKSLVTIQSNLKGRWKLEYEKGGICGSCITKFDNFYWEFSENNSIKEIFNGSIVADTTINWYKAIGTYINGDSTYIMNFYDKKNTPWNYVVDGIYNDTLVIHDNSADAVFYHFSK